MAAWNPKADRGVRLDRARSLPTKSGCRIAMAETEVKYRVNIRYQERRRRFYAEDLGGSVSLDMVEIPAGTFRMGSPEGEEGRDVYGGSANVEGPLHDVSLETFYMGMYPVTQAQWRAVAVLPQEEKPLDPEPYRFKGDNRPVETVSWEDAVEFCARLTAKTGRTYRLPTEAEWEYACRAGTETPFHFGETITTDLANYDGTDNDYGSYGRGPKGVRRGETTEVGSFKVGNAFGLYDMHGNVWEWCQDHYHDSYADKPEELKKNGNRPWQDEGASTYVLRGGSWYRIPRVCRSAIRDHYVPVARYDFSGFRVVSEAARAQPSPSTL